MLAQLSQWLLIAAIGQAHPEAALLKVAPADVDVAVRVRGLEATRDDLLAMLNAMDPAWGHAVENALSGPLAEIRQKHGDRAVTSTLLGVVRLRDQGGPGAPPPFVILLPTDDYAGTIKGFAGGKDVELKHQEGGFDAFDGPGGEGTWYAAKAPGVVALGPTKGLIAAIAKPEGKALDSVLTGPVAEGFFGGEIGVYVNAAALTRQFADQIEQGRQAFMALLDQAGQQAGNASTMQVAKDIYGGLFDSLKYADALTLHLDFAGKGLHLAGFLKVKPDSEAAKALAGARAGEVAAIGQMPPGAMTYAYMNVGAKTFDRLQGMSLKMVAAGGKLPPEMEKATAAFHNLGRIESLGSAWMENGMRTLNVIKTDDPAKFVDLSLKMLQAMGGADGQGGLYKDIKIEREPRTHGGMAFTHASATINMEKLAEISGNNPAQLESMKAMFGDGRMGFWFGHDGHRLLQVVAPTWDEARPMIDAYLKPGGGGAGKSPGFQAVLSELPERAGFVMLFNAQGLVRMMARQFAGLAKKPDLKAPEDMPKEPAYLGGSFTPRPADGYEFHLAIPGAVGPVIQKGMIPLFQAFGQAGVNQ